MGAQNRNYFCLSDLHLGAKNSVLSVHFDAGSDDSELQGLQCLRTFVQALREYIPAVYGAEKNDLPTLVLLGGCLDFDFGKPSDVIHAFQRFIDALYSENKPCALFNPHELIYVPGNNDHRIWQQMKDALLLKNLANEGINSASLSRQSSNIYDEEGLPSYLLTELIKAKHPALTVSLRYPNWGLKAENNRRVFFHHGHFIQGSYRLMSKLTQVLTGYSVNEVDEIEAQNSTWVDFLWSNLGGSSQAPDSMKWLSETMQDATVSRQNAIRLSRIICNYLDKQFGVNVNAEVATGFCVEKFLSHFLNRTLVQGFSLESEVCSAALSASSIANLKWYLSQPLLRQVYQAELATSESYPHVSSFIFGHTRKPFQSCLPVEGFDHNIKIFNTGGWQVKQGQLSSFHGAAAVFIDKELNVASLRLFDFSKGANKSQARRVFAEAADGKEDRDNSLLKRMGSALQDEKLVSLWREFQEAIFERSSAVIMGQKGASSAVTMSPF